MTLAARFLALSLLAMALDAGIALAVSSSSLMLGARQVFAVSAQNTQVSSVAQDRAGKRPGLFQCCIYGGIALAIFAAPFALAS